MRIIGLYFVSRYAGSSNEYSMVASFILGFTFAFYCAMHDALYGKKWYWFGGPKKGKDGQP